MQRIAIGKLAGCASMLVLLMTPAAASELTAAQIIEKNAAARGGLDAWRKIQTMVWVGHIESTNAPAPSLPFVLELKRPNKTRFEISAQMQTSVRMFDGIQGWKLRPAPNGKPELQPYTPDDLNFARDGQGIDGPLMDYAAKGNVVTLDGIDEIEGHKAYRLNVKLPSGHRHQVWIDAQNFLDIKYDRESHSVSGQSGMVQVFYRNYKTVEGLQIPLTIESRAMSRTSDKMVIDRVVLNQPLDDHRFTRPNVTGRSNMAARPFLHPTSSLSSGGFKPGTSMSGFLDAPQ